MMPFTWREKAQCAEREVAIRRHVYKNRVLTGRMSDIQARREIALMEEIAADLRRAEAKREKLL
jgi:hypothetical protein